MKIFHIVGARPNFMKAAPVIAALAKKDNLAQLLVHTGQHYDANMSDIFFRQLGLPEPDVNLEAGSGSHAVQTAQIMIKFEEVVRQNRPDLTLVYGDVNSTVAATLVCAKLGIKVGHVEAGLRSFDRKMPEEINRLVTDQLADLLFTPSADGNDNLKAEGVAPEKIFLVGNVMIDTLLRLLEKAALPGTLGLPERYLLVTLHRPSNVDEPEMLRKIIETLNAISKSIPIIFPIHPRTHRRIEEFQLKLADPSRLLLLDPVGYLEFLGLQRAATAVVTDSGGVQEETTFLGIPCFTVRKNTERPITITLGTNVLVGQDMEKLQREVAKLLREERTVIGNRPPPLWDGRAGERIADIVIES